MTAPSRAEQNRRDAAWNCPDGGIRAIQERNGYHADEVDWPTPGSVTAAQRVSEDRSTALAARAAALADLEDE